jgi:hypothetical protein
MNTTSEIIAAILCGFGVALGFVLFFFTMRSIIQMTRKSLWSKTTGTITDYKVVEKIDEDGNSHFVTQVQYKYEVDGNSYRAKNKRVGLYYYVTIEEEDEVSDPIGKQLIVHYLRSKPNKSELSLPNYRFIDSFGTVIGLGLILFCSWVLRLFLITIFP